MASSSSEGSRTTTRVGRNSATESIAVSAAKRGLVPSTDIYRLAAESCGRGLVILDSAFSCLTANRIWLDFHKRTLAELVQLNFVDVVSQRAFDDVYRSRFQDCLQGSIVTVEVPTALSDTGTPICETWYPLRNDESLIVGVVGIVHNPATEYCLTLAELTDRRQQYDALFNNTHSAMMIQDPATGAIVDVNPPACRMYGWPKETMLAMRMTEINTLAENLVLAAMMRAKTREQSQFQFQHRIADGTLRDVEVRSGPIRWNGRDLLCSVIIDITDKLREQREAAARQAQLAVLNERFAQLSPREREILDRIVAGQLNKVVAHELSLSQRTVEKHRASIMRKLSVTSTAELVRVTTQLTGDR